MTILKAGVIFSLFLISYAVYAIEDKLQGAWLMQSDIPTYYQFNDDGSFIVNFVHLQTKRVMAVSSGSYRVDGDKLILNQEGQQEALEQTFKINGDQMDWNVISEYETYGGKVLLTRETEIQLHTPETYYAEDNKNIYSTFLK